MTEEVEKKLEEFLKEDKNNFVDLYQFLAKQTAMYPEKYKLFYPALGINGEAGEVAEKVKKIMRDENGVLTPEKKEELIKEIGDCGWYLSALCSDLDVSLSYCLQKNIKKLFSRKERGVITGSGDNR
jgi:NTP pyrophosphatase (non-canonical NTP hydrolase)